MGKVLLKKKGQLGLVDIFSMMLYFFVALILLLVLNIAGCFLTSKTEASIGVDVNLATSVRADAQLDSMLRTMMPDANGLKAKLDFLKNSGKPDFSRKLNVNFADAKKFLDNNPELYAKVDYSEFISRLHALYPSNKDMVEHTFKAVTAAMFMRAAKDYPKKGEYTFYLLPVGVKFNPADLKPSSRSDICSDYDLCVQYLPPEVVPQTQKESGKYAPIYKAASQPVQAIPLADYTIAKVEFRYYRELSFALPKA